jgi:uncharacterized membrane protein YqjE
MWDSYCMLDYYRTVLHDWGLIWGLLAFNIVSLFVRVSAVISSTQRLNGSITATDSVFERGAASQIDL